MKKIDRMFNKNNQENFNLRVTGAWRVPCLYLQLLYYLFSWNPRGKAKVGLHRGKDIWVRLGKNTYSRYLVFSYQLYIWSSEPLNKIPFNDTTHLYDTQKTHYKRGKQRIERKSIHSSILLIYNRHFLCVVARLQDGPHNPLPLPLKIYDLR